MWPFYSPLPWQNEGIAGLPQPYRPGMMQPRNVPFPALRNVPGMIAKEFGALMPNGGGSFASRFPGAGVLGPLSFLLGSTKSMGPEPPQYVPGPNGKMIPNPAANHQLLQQTQLPSNPPMPMARPGMAAPPMPSNRPPALAMMQAFQQPPPAKIMSKAKNKPLPRKRPAFMPRADDPINKVVTMDNYDQIMPWQMPIYLPNK